MNTKYHVSYEIRKVNGRTQWLYTKDAETEETARKDYERILGKTNVTEARLIQADHYAADELVPWCQEAHPNGATSYKILATYSRI